MVKRPRSFRRLLLLRILLLSTPILLIGQYVTLRKARTSLLETARQNVASSAVRKADKLEQDVSMVQSDLLLLSQTQALQSGTLAEVDGALERFVATVPYQVRCIELRNPAPELIAAQAQLLPDTPEIIITPETPETIETTEIEPLPPIALSSCNQETLLPESSDVPWLDIAQVASNTGSQSEFYLVSLSTAQNGADLPRNEVPIDLVVAVPIYGIEGEFRYTLTLKAGLSQIEDTNPRSLVGDTVVIDSDNRVVVHPDADQVGQPVEQLAADERLRSIIGSVRAGNNSNLHLFSFLTSGDEWLAGYSGAQIKLTPGEETTWTVLAVTPLNKALHALKDIRQILVLLTLGLLSANALLAIYVARGLSLPVERLIRYTQQVQNFSTLKAAPRHRNVWELDYLGQVLERMLGRLKAGSTELRQAWEDAQLANQLKNEFLANTSHELRTPLNAIIGCIRLVRDGVCDDREEELEFLERADNAAIHLLQIINDILDIAKIEAGTVSLDMEPVDLRMVLQDVLDLQIFQMQQKGLALNRPEFPSEALMVQADSGKLKQVLMNVIYNAVKFTHIGEISIGLVIEDPAQGTTSTESQDTPKSTQTSEKEVSMPRVQLVIQDTGIGIDPQEQHKLFRPFAMVDGTHTRRYEGTGLGLAISRNFMKLMGGTISLYSAGHDQGTTVTITLPLLPQSSTEVLETDKSQSEDDKNEADEPDSPTKPTAINSGIETAVH